MLKVKLTPSHAADLSPALAQQHEEFHNATKCIVVGRCPDCGKLRVAQDSIACWWRFRAGGTDHRICLRQPIG
jgi:hypothetical protein